MYPDEETSGGAASDPAPGSDGRCDGRHDRVTYNFYSTVDARGGRFGDSFDGYCRSDWRVRPTGVLRDAEVAATVSNYVPPPAFLAAVARLRRDHLVVIEGEPGGGRRAGALALLREVTDGTLVALSPSMTAQELAGGPYQHRHGYLVFDSDGVGSPGNDPDWAEVAAQLRAAGAYLVVATTPTRSHGVPPAVPCLAWEPPPAAEVLRGHLAGSWAEDDVDRLVNYLATRLPARYALRWLADLARLVNAHRNPAQALTDLAELEGRQVDQWFDQPRTSRELAEITVSAFLGEANEQAYRSRLAHLVRILRLPHRPDGQSPPWAVSSGLLRIRRIAYRGDTSRMVSFKRPSHRRFALSRLWDTGPRWFLAAVRSWIDTAAIGEDQMAIASSLALLTMTDFEGVDSAFLEPWSRGGVGQPGQVSAAYVLWYMCREEATAPLALRTGIRWSRSADRNQQATAILAFSGELGACYPTDAARRLWHLAIQTDGSVRTASTAALGRLFAHLVDRTHQAGTILTILTAHRHRPSTIAGGSDLTSVAVDAVASVLAARSYRTGRLAVAELLKTEPEWLEVITWLLAGVLRNRTTRANGITTLWDLLHAFPHTSPKPTAEAYAFGLALATVLTSAERARLRRDLTQLDRRLRRDAGTGSPAKPLVACLAAVAVSG